MDSIQLFMGIVVFGGIALFLITREAWLWYFRINHAIRVLESIDRSLKTLPSVRQEALRVASIERGERFMSAGGSTR